MPVTWNFAEDVLHLGGVPIEQARGTHKPAGIAPEEAERQRVTASGILDRLQTQPGIILADEVGMGKTYVALAVVASVLLSERESGLPVVIMSPPGLTAKWMHEWSQFKRLCARKGALDWIRPAEVKSATQYFKLLDDPIESRPHLLFMSTTSFWAALNDPWVKLAFIRGARSKTNMDYELRETLFKWTPDLIHNRSQVDADLAEKLLTSKPGEWRKILERNGIPLDDDPVPAQLVNDLDSLSYGELVAFLREELPGRRGSPSNARINQMRQSFARKCNDLYMSWLRRASWRASLLILDEAHHAKNDGTRLARLFRENHAHFRNRFDRLLFLTATPFQLGHHELIRILHSFSAAHWDGPRAPLHSREEFGAALSKLHEKLNQNQIQARQLDRVWGRLGRERFVELTEDKLTNVVTEWVDKVRATQAVDLDPLEAEIKRTLEAYLRSRELAELDSQTPWQGLRTWLIRHNRSPFLSQEGEQRIMRREVHTGNQIVSSEADGTGLSLQDDGALPFLLAVRAQGELAVGSASARAFFAEGLCSSYEAFHHTRDQRNAGLDEDDDQAGEDSVEEKTTLIPISWYEEQVAKLIPSKKAADELRLDHPKVRPTVQRTLELWERGEKVLIFCFYLETTRAINEHLVREVEDRIRKLVARKLGLPPEADVGDRMESIVRRLRDERSPLHREMLTWLKRQLNQEAYGELADHEAKLIEMLMAYVRSPAFIARFFPLEVPEVQAALADEAQGAEVFQRGAAALIDAIEKNPDGSGITTAARVHQFLAFCNELASQGGGDRESALVRYLDAVTVYTEPRTVDEDEGIAARAGSYRVLPVVRRVFGPTSKEARQRLMFAFNSPLFPEILVTSAVMGEGVDLHRFCRHVIHHDLCWNPSTLEQRTGRLDRLRCKAEYSRQPILIYQPYIAGSADEKMFRVVRDRERWFQVVMGQKFTFDEAASEAIANRVPLPEMLARELVFDLKVWEKTPVRV